jgi:8-oxo-dGTP pyrophosphatase MutT (NUDIX family)
MMRMEDRASAIIISKRHILLIHRIRARQEYYVFPGGHIKAGESAEDACVREVLEETGLQTAWLQPAFDHAVDARMGHYFFVQVQPGRLSLGGPEALKRTEQNRYLLEWIPLVQVSEYSLRPEAVRDVIARVVAEDGPVREAQDLAQHRERLQELLREIRG